MQTEILINDGSRESRIAIVEDNRVAEVWVERPEKERMVGDIYKGRVTAVLPGLQAAFVEIAQERTAFLQARDMRQKTTKRSKTVEVLVGDVPAMRPHLPFRSLFAKETNFSFNSSRNRLGLKVPA